VKASPSKPSAPSAQYFCAIKKPVISDLAATASGSASLKWFTKSSSTELSPSLPLVNGNKYYTRSYEGGCLSKDSVEVLVSLGDTTAPTYTKQPTVNPITLEFCSSSKLTLDSLNKSVVGNLKKWYDGTTLLTDMSQLLTSKTYTVSQTNSKGCESTLTLSIKVTINVTPSNPTVSPVDQTFCSAENPKIASLIPSLIVDPTLKWYDKNGVLKLKDDLLVNGSIYYATKKDVLNGCESPKSETAKVTVKIVSSPAQDTLKDTTICFSTQASLRAVGESSGVFKWFSSETGGNLLKTGIKLDTTLSVTSSFYVSQSLGSCESARKKVTVFVTPKLIIPSISNQNQSFCEKNNPIVSDLLPKGDTIQWYLKSTGLKVSKKDKLLNSSQYIVSLVKGECESEKSALSVTVKLMPRLKVLSSQPSSCGLKDGSITISSPSLNLNGSLVLSKDSINTIPLVNLPSYTLSGLKAGSYQLSYNNNVCVFDTLISLNDPGSPVKPILSPSGATKFCNGNKVKVTYTNPTGDPFYWHDGSTDTSIYITKKSVCYVVVTNPLGCKSISLITDVDVITFPTVTKLTGNVDSLFYCSSDGKMIKDLPYAPYSPQTIEWFDGNKKITSPNDKLASGFYYCAEKELNSGLFCINDKRDTVYVTLNTMHVDIDVQQSVCGQNNGKISLKITGTPGLKYDYSWRKDGSILTETTQSIGNISEGSYKVTIKSKGCILQDSLILLVCKDPIIPQILTPDGNLKNDLWEIGFKYKYPNVTVEIYNRWGNLVYKSEKPYNDNWDGKPNVAGTIGNETLPSGTYYYIIDKGNNESIEKGYLELIK
jgi:gliding motility-associated-like protein